LTTNVDILVSLNISENKSHHRKLINQITSLYGREILDKIHDLENLKVKIKRREGLLLHISMVLHGLLVLKIDLDMDLKCQQTNVDILVSLISLKITLTIEILSIILLPCTKGKFWKKNL
jgi:hypothetical protein